jgi:thioredoxin:protein disulfide reductase
MQRRTVVALAILSAVGLAVIPAVLPTGPSTGLNAEGLLASGQLWLAAGVIFLGGLLTSLTPCVYPLIPITVGVFGARQADSKGRAFLLTSAYVVGMGLVFSALGVGAALSGKVFGSALGNRWLVVGLAIFLLVLASSMFGAFELALPSGLAAKLNGVGGGGIVGALLMGSVAGFLAAPCTGPVLSGVLAWVSNTKDPVLGGLLLFIYALGIGVPFFLIGVFALRLPKSGPWMDAVKSVFGVALVALALSYIRDAFPSLREGLNAIAAQLGLGSLIAIAAALAFAGVLAGAVHRTFAAGDRTLKSVGVVTVVVAFLLRMASPQAGATQLQPDGTVGGSFSWALTFKADESQTATPFDALLAKAKADCKPVLIDFFADWCAACKELDEMTYVAPAVVASSKRFVTIKVDGTNDHAVLDGLYERFGVKGLPTVAFIDATGQVLTEPKVTGFMPADSFVAQLGKVKETECSHSP